MKTKFLVLAALLATATAAFAAPLTAPTAVHSRPEEKSPTLTVLKAGTNPVPASEISRATPSGWMAVELSGPHIGYVQNKDLAKSLDVIPGASIRVAPKADASVLTIAEKDDKAVIDGVLGKWSRISLEKKIVGYIKIALPPAATPSPISPAAAPVASNELPTVTTTARVIPSPAPVPPAPAPAAPQAQVAVTPGRAAPMTNVGDSGSGTLPRSFQGKFVSTRRPMTPRHPYDWALNDDSGKRYALLDVSKLLQTEQIEKYTDRMVIVYGAAKPSPNGRDILIQVESLQLK